MNPPCYHRSLLQEETAATSSVRSPATSFTFNSPLALTIILLLIVLFFIAFFSLYIRRSYYITNSNHNSISGRRRNVGKHDGVHCAAVRSLPGFPYGGDLKMKLECSICLSEFEERETVKEIPYCRHVFHPVCIDTWLSSHGSCPMCRSTRLFLAVDDIRVGTVRDLSVVTRGT